MECVPIYFISVQHLYFSFFKQHILPMVKTVFHIGALLFRMGIRSTYIIPNHITAIVRKPGMKQRFTLESFWPPYPFQFSKCTYHQLIYYSQLITFSHLQLQATPAQQTALSEHATQGEPNCIFFWGKQSSTRYI